MKMTIAIDAMGGDIGTEVTVPAAIEFLRKSKRHNIVLVGLKDRIQEIIAREQANFLLESGRLSLVAASQIVAMDEAPAHAVKRKKDSSMRVGINLVKEGQADAFVSAGNTGALMATARFVLKTLPGIDRPAIISTIPCENAEQTLHMLDLGANVDSAPQTLLQFGIMGAVLTEIVDEKPNPKVALLNVGAEEIKGSKKVKDAAVLFSQSSLNYVGYIESNELYHGKVDVIVSDGFEGNVALKTGEGTASMIFDVMRQEFKRNWLSKIIACMALPVLQRMRERLDPRSHNGATLIGLNGIVVKSHGSADSFGFLHAIKEAAKQAELNLTSHISRKINEIITDS